MQDNNFQDINEERENLQKIESEWLESLENLQSSKSENINEDLFSAIEYLKTCDIFFKNSFIELKKIEVLLKKFTKLKNEQKGESLKSMIELINGIKQFKMKIQDSLEKWDGEYSILSEGTLRKSQDIITKFIETNANYPSIKNELNQDLDRKLFLQELKDSLEDYRQAREESVSESRVEIPKLPDHLIPEDLGEEFPEIDPILSQLDTAIIECDSALLISEISETD